MKKKLSIILAFVMIFISTATVFATPTNQSNREYGFNILYDLTLDNIEIELSEYAGAYYYYEQKGKTAVSMRKNVDGTIDVYNNDGKGKLYYYKIDNRETIVKYEPNHSSDTTNDLLNLFNKIKQEITLKNNSITPNRIKEISDIVKSGDIGLLGGGTDDLCRENLINKFGNEYSDRYITSLTERGYTAKLYGYMSFGFYKEKSKYITALIDIAELAASFYTLPPIITKILFVKTVGGIVYALADQNIATYSTTVYFDKYGKVNNVLRFRAGKNEFGRVNIGDKGSHYEYKSMNKDYIFDDNTGILRKAIDNQIAML